jgi:hypothetical protein
MISFYEDHYGWSLIRDNRELSIPNESSRYYRETRISLVDFDGFDKQTIKPEYQFELALHEAQAWALNKCIYQSEAALVEQFCISHAEKEYWAWEAQRKQAIQRGLEDVAKGNVCSLGSFAQYADIEIED